MNPLNEAVGKRPFQQLPFMSEQQFASFLRERDLDVGVTGVRAFVHSGLIEKLHSPNGDFHPFQIWPINKLFQGLGIRLETGIGLAGTNPEPLKRFIDQNWDHSAEHLRDFPKSPACLEFNRQIFPLLLWLESYFLPVARGSRPGLVTISTIGDVNADGSEWDEWRYRTDIAIWLEKYSISVDQLSDWRFHTLFDAFRNDPAPDLYLLLRSMPFNQRRKFKGRLRLTYDLYEITEITRLFLERVSEKPMVKEWHPNGPPDTPWVEWNYGSQPKFGNPEFLRAVVRDFGLDPAFRVQWLVEGPTEEGFILRYTERLGANIREFVTIRNFHGDSTFQNEIPAVDADLRAAREEECFVTVTFDDDSQATRNRVEGLLANGLLNLRFVLNDPDFELGNFTVEQLIAVAVAWASDLSKPISMDQRTLVRDVDARISPTIKFEKALNDILHFNNEQFKLSKGTEWGERLADLLFETRDSERELTKMERQIQFVLRASQPFIDYSMSIKNLDTSSLEIK